MEQFNLEFESVSKYLKDLISLKTVQLNKSVEHRNGILKYRLLNEAVGLANLFGGEQRLLIVFDKIALFFFLSEEVNF